MSWKWLLGVLLLVGVAAPAQAQSTINGMTCEPGYGYCTDRFGIRHHYPREYFFGAAVPAPAAAPAISGPVDDVFQPVPGATCDNIRFICYTSDGANIGLTRQYYGEVAAQAVAQELARSALPPPPVVNVFEEDDDDDAVIFIDRRRPRPIHRNWFVHPHALNPPKIRADCRTPGCM